MPQAERARHDAAACAVLKAAAYLRVSTRQQDLEAQRRAILQAATARGDEIAQWFEEKVGGHKLEREQLTALRAAARAGEIRRLYVFKVDRLSRGGIRETLTVVQELRAHGCELASVADGFSFDGPAGEIVLAVLAWAAQIERGNLGERISAARDRVEAAGGRWGRPRRVDPGTLARARLLKAEGHTLRYIAAALKVPRATIAAALSQKGHYKPKAKPGV